MSPTGMGRAAPRAPSTYACESMRFSRSSGERIPTVLLFWYTSSTVNRSALTSRSTSVLASAASFSKVRQSLPSKSEARATTARRAEREMAAKRADYFAAGTQVVWDVDVLRGELIRVFRANDPENPSTFRRGESRRRRARSSWVSNACRRHLQVGFDFSRPSAKIARSSACRGSSVGRAKD